MYGMGALERPHIAQSSVFGAKIWHIAEMIDCSLETYGAIPGLFNSVSGLPKEATHLAFFRPFCRSKQIEEEWGNRVTSSGGGYLYYRRAET